MDSIGVGLRDKIAYLGATIVLAFGVLGGLSAPASAATSVSCRTYTGIPVALAAGEPKSYSIAGEMCATPRELVSGETVQLLIHGATYNQTYWDFGTIDGVRYSYARDVAAAGYPTFAIDEIGAGQSSHPPSADITIQAAAYVAHEAVQDLRDGAIGGRPFGKVIEVGHSLGSLTAWVEAATYHDVAGAIITGAAHAESSFVATEFASDVSPAIGEPAGYLTTVPGTRAALFYNAADSDPKVIAQDEDTKDVVSDTEYSTGVSLLQSTLTQQITVPVLVMLGGDDNLFCGPEVDGATFSCSSGQEVASEEAPYYAAQAQLRACVIPDSGHSINLALNHDLEEADALAWSYEYVGQKGIPAITSRTLPPDCSS
jgi:pimeloyl-ACP methyl ester carboxylesterase